MPPFSLSAARVGIAVRSVNPLRVRCGAGGRVREATPISDHWATALARLPRSIRWRSCRSPIRPYPPWESSRWQIHATCHVGSFERLHPLKHRVGRWRVNFVHDPPAGEEHSAIGMRSGQGVVRRHNDGSSGPRRTLEKLGHLAASGLVGVVGRLVSKDDRRPRRVPLAATRALARARRCRQPFRRTGPLALLWSVTGGCRRRGPNGRPAARLRGETNTTRSGFEPL